MHIKLYNNGELLVPLKCGSRYLDKIFKDNSKGFDIKEFQQTLFTKIKTIVVRPPFEHLSSALHTAILTYYNDTEKNENIPIDYTPIIEQFCFYNKDSVQNTHWRYDLYETFYGLWRTNRNNVNVIELKDLSLYLKTIGIEKLPEYDSKEYDFSKYDYWCSKEELMLFIKTSFPDQWKNLMKQVTEAEIFYNALINKELLPIKLL
jgi:hypothetical protein